MHGNIATFRKANNGYMALWDASFKQSINLSYHDPGIGIDLRTVRTSLRYNYCAPA